MLTKAEVSPSLIHTTITEYIHITPHYIQDLFNQDITIASTLYVFDWCTNSCLHERGMAVATISLFILCENSCGGADHYPCLSCLYNIVAYMSGTWRNNSCVCSTQELFSPLSSIIDSDVFRIFLWLSDRTINHIEGCKCSVFLGVQQDSLFQSRHDLFGFIHCEYRLMTDLRIMSYDNLVFKIKLLSISGRSIFLRKCFHQVQIIACRYFLELHHYALQMPWRISQRVWRWETTFNFRPSLFLIRDGW